MKPVTKVAAVALFAAVLSGCSLLVAPQTQHPYDPSDGVGVEVGDVKILNALVITEDGEVGSFSGTAVNRAEDDIDLTLQYVSGGDKVDVVIALDAGETVILGDELAVRLEGIDAQPGSLLEIYFQYGDEPGKQVAVPVLDARLEQYVDLVPMPVPTPTPSATSTPAA